MLIWRGRAADRSVKFEVLLLRDGTTFTNSTHDCFVQSVEFGVYSALIWEMTTEKFRAQRLGYGIAGIRCLIESFLNIFVSHFSVVLPLTSLWRPACGLEELTRFRVVRLDFQHLAELRLGFGALLQLQ
jgi:hypothetical protein